MTDVNHFGANINFCCDIGLLVLGTSPRRYYFRGMAKVENLTEAVRGDLSPEIAALEDGVEK